jgi:WD40 repeat protein
VGALAWYGNLLASGGKDRLIKLHDPRVSNDAVVSLSGHTYEVCGLKWSPDGEWLASGGTIMSFKIGAGRVQLLYKP